MEVALGDDKGQRPDGAHTRAFEGRVEELMDMLLKQMRSPKAKEILRTIQADVYTPARAHLRWDYGQHCPLCGKEQQAGRLATLHAEMPWNAKTI